MAADDGTIRQLAAAHVDPERQRLAHLLLARYPVDPGRSVGPANVIRTGRPELLQEVTDEILEALADDEENLQMLKALGLRSAMITPLIARGRIIGAIAFASAESGRVFGRDDLALAEQLSTRAAMAVDNARLYQRLSGAERAARETREQLGAILGGVADGVTAQAPDGSLVYANDAAARQLGLESADELLAADIAAIIGRYEMLDVDRKPFPRERLPGRRALAGEDPPPELICYRIKSTGEERWSQVKATAIRDENGTPTLAINVVEDVTEQLEREESQRLLAEASGALASSLDVAETFPRVAVAVARRLGDWCSLEVVDPDGAARMVAFAATEPGRQPAAEELMRRYPVGGPGRRYLGRDLDAGESRLMAEITDQDLAAAARDPEHLALFRQLRPRSAMTVPLVVRGTTIGAITVVTAASGRMLDEDDLVLLEEVAGRCALALDNARLYNERSRIARTLQESLLPPLLPDLPGLDVAARFRAAGSGIEVGGDFYDLFELGDAGWAVAIGDVCGKGTGAAAITALARYTVRAAAMRQNGPSQILGLLNEALLRQRTDRRFCTVLFGRIAMNGRGASFDFASGGHPLPLLLRASGSHELGEPGTLLGIVSDPALSDDSVKLEPGDALVLYTDGVTDAAAPEHIWTPLALGEALGSPLGLDADEIAERTLAAALDGAGAEPRDDIAIMVFKVPEAA
jgi:PAS domain S-box-containing protein